MLSREPRSLSFPLPSTSGTVVKVDLMEGYVARMQTVLHSSAGYFGRLLASAPSRLSALVVFRIPWQATSGEKERLPEQFSISRVASEIAFPESEIEFFTSSANILYFFSEHRDGLGSSVVSPCYAVSGGIEKYLPIFSSQHRFLSTLWARRGATALSTPF